MVQKFFSGNIGQNDFLLFVSFHARHILTRKFFGNQNSFFLSDVSLIIGSYSE